MSKTDAPLKADEAEHRIRIALTSQNPFGNDQKLEDQLPGGGWDPEGVPLDIRVRITLTSQNVQSLEKVCEQLIRGAKEEHLDIKGPSRMPTKTLRITTRKTPCGEGSKTWDRYQMRIHKRGINLVCPSDALKKITSISIEPGVDVEVTIADSA